jgi:glycosyltransferase involved in cell wall biosynthesis/GT2 family glycosyltransferase
MARRIVFVTQNHDTVHKGGAGAFIGELSRRLAADGHEVTVLFADPQAADARVDGVDVVAVPVPEPDGTLDWFVARSRSMAERLGELIAETGPVDLVEFTDFEATALWALLHRHRLGLAGARLGIRLHGPVEAITAAMGAAPPPLDRVGELERLALGMADVVLVPLPEVGDWTADRYGVDPHRLVVAPPPIVPVTPVARRPSAAPTFIAFGRLTEQKGPHDLVRAALPILDAVPGARLRFVGPDGWSASEDRPMSEVVRGLVPARHRDRVELVGPLPRDQALASMATAWAVVVASRYESFCLAAHEVRRAGIPVVAPDLPAFRGFGEGYGIRLYDGSVDGLSRALAGLATDRSLTDALAAAPPPPVGDAGAAYAGPLPEPRHPQSQAGLATAASQRMAELLAPRVPRGAGAARRLLRLLPEPVARLAVRALPQRLKDRLRPVASWPAERARRDAERRRRRTRAAAVGGEFPELDEPDVTVVIPCYEQGQWVTDAVVSVFEQTHRSWEVVLVDDGSTNRDTVDILEGLAAWPRVRLLRQDNAGLAAARNAGIAAAAGRFVVPLDADDELAPAFLERMLAALADGPDAGFAHCWAELFGDVEGIWATRPVNPYWDLLANSVVGCVLLRREAWAAVGGYAETMRDGNEDWDLWVRLRAAGWGQVRVMVPLFRYRKHGVSMSVGTEAAFEEGRRRLAGRHPGLYAPEAMRAMKRDWYPLLTVIGDGPLDAPDAVEAVPAGPGGLAGAVAATRGKYVADRRGAMWPVDAAVALAERLEDAPDAAFAHDPDTGAAVWRRWALLDPGSGLDGGLGPPPPGDGLGPGAFPDPEWTIPEGSVPAGARLVRQRPEEDGRFPAWVVD